MKNYYNHLITTLSFGEVIDVKRKPILRSSAIFPVLLNDEIDCRILFLGYWFIKRNIPEVTLIITLRAEGGAIIKREMRVIQEVRAYEISVRSLLYNLNTASSEFLGSIELEVFSTRDMVFPYPAFVLNFLSSTSSTFVHTTGRVYNDLEDLIENEESHVAESGFDILPKEEFEPYFAFVNGGVKFSNPIILVDLINMENEVKRIQIQLGELQAYQTKWIKFLDHDDIAFFKGAKGTAKIHHKLTGFFPRFIAGNIRKNGYQISLTHTYYDTFGGNTKMDYWLNPDPSMFFDATFFIPVYMDNNRYTELAIYPIYAKGSLAISLIFYDVNGEILAEKHKFDIINEGINVLKYIRIDKIANELNIIDYNNQLLSAKIILNGDGKVPARLKFGLNIGMSGDQDIPCNICFNAKMPNEKTIAKPGTFKWAPIMIEGNSYVIIGNDSFEKNYTKKAKLIIRIWNHQKENSFDIEVLLNPHGSYRFDWREHLGLKEFLDGKGGWLTVTSDNPMINAWYFQDMGFGVIGGDHSF